MIEITAMVGAVIGLSQIAKTNGLQTKYIPIFNLTLGIILGVLFLSQDIKMNIFQGMIIGLSASGLFDHTKIIKRITIGNEKEIQINPWNDRIMEEEHKWLLEPNAKIWPEKE